MSIDFTNYYLHYTICIIIMTRKIPECRSYPSFCFCEVPASFLVSLLVFPQPPHQEPLKVIKKCPPGERFNTLQVNSPARDPHPALSHLISSQTVYRFPYGLFGGGCVVKIWSVLNNCYLVYKKFLH